ncbi:FprA family A-type flavoprotein [Thermodesulfobacteriota bacterium]
MSGPFKAVKVTDSVYWVGAIDWAIRDFHGYSTSRGTTYNAFLILADKITLIDTVKAPFKDEMLSRIASVVDPGKIDIIISNHSEMDHSGCLFDVIEAVKPEKVFASLMGVKALSAHFHRDDEVEALKDGDTLSLGNMTLSFLETRMLHWPDSMFTYLAEERLLFSQDGFGMHLATTERFADEIDEEVLLWEGAKYFANILLPFSPFVLKLLDRVEGLDLVIDIVAPDHGPIWRKDIDRVLALYSGWASRRPTAKAVVTYDTMWQSTALMARTICEGLTTGGATAKLLPLASSHRSDVATEILDAGALLVGSPTMNNHLFPTVADVLTYLKGLRPRNLVGAAFGSHGWSGEGAKQAEEMLTTMNVEMLGTIQTQYVPDDETLGRCFSLGELVAKRLLEICGGG